MLEISICFEVMSNAVSKAGLAIYLPIKYAFLLIIIIIYFVLVSFQKTTEIFCFQQVLKWDKRAVTRGDLQEFWKLHLGFPKSG